MLGVCMLDERDHSWKALMMTWMTYPTPQLPNDFPRRGKTSYFDLDVMLLGQGHGGEMPLF
jgi:hypothetical protein